MAGYRKKIAYLDYLENGMKIKNAGFVRLEESNGKARLEMRVKNIPEVFGGQYELKADAGGVVGRISLLRGGGSCCVVWKTGGAAPEGKRFVRADGVYVRLPGRHLLQAVWAEPVELCVEAADVETDGGRTERGTAGWEQQCHGGADSGGAYGSVNQDGGTDGSVSQDGGAYGSMSQDGGADGDPQQVDGAYGSVSQDGGADGIPQRDGGMESARKPAAGEAKAAVEAAVEKLESRREGMRSERTQSERAQSERTQATEGAKAHREEQPAAEEAEPQQKERPASEEPVCYGDKWEQLSHMYPMIHPFGDEREYLSIAPKDFVVLRSEYQKMVHNSFLLHGYYNYRHLILGRVGKKGECRYYLGVPGNFYGREKMVAEMFGFEAFEGEEEPAKAGDFGYFMKQVEI